MKYRRHLPLSVLATSLLFALSAQAQDADPAEDPVEGSPVAVVAEGAAKRGRRKAVSPVTTV